MSNGAKNQLPRPELEVSIVSKEERRKQWHRRDRGIYTSDWRGELRLTRLAWCCLRANRITRFGGLRCFYISKCGGGITLPPAGLL